MTRRQDPADAVDPELFTPGRPVTIHHRDSGTSVLGRIGASLPGDHLLVELDALDAWSLPEGAPVALRITRDRDAAYECPVTVVRRGDGVVDLSWPAVVHRLQHRRNVRLPVTVAASLAPAGPRRLSDGPAHWASVTIVDVSAGGAAVVSDTDHRLHDVVLVRFDLPSRRGALHVHARARVVRREPGGNGRWRYGIELIDLPGRLEDELVSAVFHHLSAATPAAPPARQHAGRRPAPGV